ncbi:OprO/OprP family phosphate-selective porin [Acidobacteria bacterium AH-259-O06]|nr:OprO/OprP family phosphate-selective porin [Acidobacteria bacterium AH-259-O06]
MLRTWPWFLLLFYGLVSALVAIPQGALAQDLRPESLYEEDSLSDKDGFCVEGEQEEVQEGVEGNAQVEEGQEEGSQVKVVYGPKGIQLTTPDGRFLTQIQWRLQARYSFPFDSEPRSVSQFDAQDSSTFKIRRARIKVGGHAYQPWLKYDIEYDFPGNRLLDFRLTIDKYEWLQLRVGQWKSNYNRERVDSSGNQQFVERSIVNRAFTIDRQQGVMLFGHLMPGKPADSWYYAGVFTGTGRGASANDDGRMMWMGRFQWNFLRRDLKFSQSDLDYHEEPTGSIAFAALTNRSRFTRFSSSGGGQLDGFEEGDPGQYSVKQLLEEIAFKYRGFSFQHEYHWKQIEDTVNGTTTKLVGSYAQAGYFFHYLIPSVPKQLELGFRYAFVDPNVSLPNDRRQEYTGVLNWFFKEHRNKLTFDVSGLTLAQAGGSDLADLRVRLQWDVSF